MDDNRLQAAFTDLTGIMKRLRQECPWDRKQTHETLRRYLVEEAAEVLEALDRRDPKSLCSELGDLLFQIWFQAEVASESAGGFDLSDVVEGIAAKLRRRHPHVFGPEDPVRPGKPTAVIKMEDVRRRWEEIKRAEGRNSILDGIPADLSALTAAHNIQEKVKSVGFDWHEIRDVVSKVREEVEEFIAELPATDNAPGSGTNRRLVAEFGDLLFALVNLARHLRFHADDALRETNLKFADRFRTLESLAVSRGLQLDQLTLIEMERLWQEAKSLE